MKRTCKGSIPFDSVFKNSEYKLTVDFLPSKQTVWVRISLFALKLKYIMLKIRNNQKHSFHLVDPCPWSLFLSDYAGGTVFEHTKSVQKD